MRAARQILRARFCDPVGEDGPAEPDRISNDSSLRNHRTGLLWGLARASTRAAHEPCGLRLVEHRNLHASVSEQFVDGVRGSLEKLLAEKSARRDLTDFR